VVPFRFSFNKRTEYVQESETRPLQYSVKEGRQCILEPYGIVYKYLYIYMHIY
jgi:hypothetical protein